MDFKDYSELIEKLYFNAIKKEQTEFAVDKATIEQGMKDMSEAYSCNHWQWKFFSDAKVVDYNNASHRCAYLYKHAMLHTDLVCTMLQAIFQVGSVKEYIDSKESLVLCSLGGGPGTDIVALLLVIQQVFGFKECSAYIIDCSEGREQTFTNIVSGLRIIPDSDVISMVDESCFEYRYLGADLLNPSSFDNTELGEAISKADIITMVKFISAVACNRTGRMLMVSLFL